MTVIFRLIKMEAQLWDSLYAWVHRRPYGPDDFPYHARSQMALWMGVAVLTTPLEIAVLELLIPWPWLKITTLVLALYALLWLIMLFASLRSMPHRLEPRGVRLRYGVLTDVLIPYDRISEAHVAMARAPKLGDGLQLDGESAFLAINGEANLVLRLKEPLSLDRVFGKTPPVREVHFSTDEPKRMIERLMTRLKPVEEPVSLPAQA